jgi:U3 small nucleolar RNA-associated protein 11
LTIVPQKIDKIKAQLTALADLIKPSSINTDNTEGSGVEDDLDEHELDILREAGIVSPSLAKGKGKKPKHILFVEDEEEGVYASFVSISGKLDRC